MVPESHYLFYRKEMSQTGKKIIGCDFSTLHKYGQPVEKIMFFQHFINVAYLTLRRLLSHVTEAFSTGDKKSVISATWQKCYRFILRGTLTAPCDRIWQTYEVRPKYNEYVFKKFFDARNMPFGSITYKGNHVGNKHTLSYTAIFRSSAGRLHVGGSLFWELSPRLAERLHQYKKWASWRQYLFGWTKITPVSSPASMMSEESRNWSTRILQMLGRAYETNLLKLSRIYKENGCLNFCPGGPNAFLTTHSEWRMKDEHCFDSWLAHESFLGMLIFASDERDKQGRTFVMFGHLQMIGPNGRWFACIL